MDILTESDAAGLFELVTDVSKATPYKIRVDYAARMRIWKEQILPDRRSAICNEHSVEYVNRMWALTTQDVSRLSARVIKEMHGNKYRADAFFIINTVASAEYTYYTAEIKRILAEQGDKPQ